MTRARNIAGFSTITTTPSPVHVGPIGVLTATRIDGEFGDRLDISARNLTAAGIAATNLQVSGITTGLNVSGIITAQNGIIFNGTSTGLNVSGVGTIATLSVTGFATVGGVLTYEDVTRVDSVGVITAREQVHVGTGVSIAAGGLNVTAGVSTFNDQLHISSNIRHVGDTDTYISFSGDNQIEMYVADQQAIKFTTTSIETGDNKRIDIVNANAERSGVIQNNDSTANTLNIGADPDNSGSSSQLTFSVDGSIRARIIDSGRFGIGLASPTSALDISGGADNTVLQIRSDDAGAYMAAYDNTGASQFGHSGANLVLSADPAGSVSSSAIVFQVDSNSEKMRIDASGRLLLGTNSSRGNYGNNASGVDYKMQIEGTSATTSSLALVRNSNDANDGGLILGKTRATSVGGNTTVQAGDDLGTLSFVGSDGTSLQFGADIGAKVESGIGNDDMPVSIFFKTNAGSTSTSERMRLTHDGKLLLRSGTTTASDRVGGFESALQVEGTSATSASISICRNSSLENPPYLLFGKSRGTSVGSNTAVANGDRLGIISFNGSDGSGSFGSYASIYGEVDGSPGNSDHPGKITFYTTPDGSVSPQLRMTINNQGYVTKPNMPAFLVYAVGFGTKAFGQDHSNTDFDINYLEQIPIWGQQSISRTIVHNQGAHLTAHNYTTSGGSDGAYVKFTAPVNGYYVFFITATPAKSSVGDWWGFGLMKNFTSNNSNGDLDYYISSVNQANNGNEEKSMNGQTVVYLAKDDYVIPYARSCHRVTCTDRITFGGYMLF